MKNQTRTDGNMTCPVCGSSRVKVKKSIFAIILVICGGFAAVDAACQLTMGGNEFAKSALTAAILICTGSIVWVVGKRIKCLDCGKKSDPKQRDDPAAVELLEKGITAEARGDLDKAVLTYGEVIAKYPASAAAGHAQNSIDIVRKKLSSSI